MSRGFIPVYLLIGLIVLAALGGAYYFGKLPIKPTTSQVSIFPTPIPDEVERARQDLATKLNVDKSQIKVESVEKTGFPDGCLGCAQKGEFCTQATEFGQKVIFTYNQNNYEYHIAGNKIRSCLQDNKIANSVEAAWKTYTNSTYKYSLKYPSTWSITDRMSAYKGGIPEVVDAQFFNYENRGDVIKGNWVVMNYDTSLDEQKIYKVNNQENGSNSDRTFVAYTKSEITTSDFNGKKLYRVITTIYEKKNGVENEQRKLYRIYIPTSKGYVELASNLGMKVILEQILSTFKFN